MHQKYETRYVELYDADVRDAVEKILSTKITGTHYLAQLVRLDGETWLAQCKYSIVKSLDK